MEDLTIPKNCNPLKPVKLNLKDNSHLQGLTLADCFSCNSVQVDAIIGADHYYSFVTGIWKGEENHNASVAVESHLGLILTGLV